MSETFYQSLSTSIFNFVVPETVHVNNITICNPEFKYKFNITTMCMHYNCYNCTSIELMRKPYACDNTTISISIPFKGGWNLILGGAPPSKFLLMIFPYIHVCYLACTYRSNHSISYWYTILFLEGVYKPLV